MNREAKAINKMLRVDSSGMNDFEKIINGKKYYSRRERKLAKKDYDMLVNKCLDENGEFRAIFTIPYMHYIKSVAVTKDIICYMNMDKE